MTKRAKIATAICAFLLVAVLVVAWGAASYLKKTLSADASTREIAKIAARGEPTTMADLAGEKIPDAENAAVVYEKAFKLISTKNAKEDLNVLSKIIDTDNTPEPAQMKQAREITQRYQDVIELVREAQKRPKCKFPIEWEEKGALDVGFPHYAPIRGLARLLWANALLAAQAGHKEKAVDELILAYELNSALEDEYNIVGQMLRIVLVSGSVSTIQQVLDVCPITDAHAKRLYDCTSDTDFYRGLVRGLQGERAMGIWVYDDIRKNGPKSEMMQTGIGTASSLTKSDFNNPLFRKHLDMDEMFFLKQMDKSFEEAKRPYRLAENKNATDVDIPKTYIVSALLVNTPNLRAKVRDGGIAKIALVRSSLALTAYKARKGSYPATLGEAVSEMGWELPEDPFSGKPVIYKKQDNGYLLYSIGPDLKDNGGIPSQKYAKPGTPSDMVWEVSR